MAIMKLKIGNRVKDLKFHVGMTGTVIGIEYSDPANPIEDHGSITVRLDPKYVGKFPCSPKDEEHYVEYGWEEFLEVIDTGV
jgi:hypothetical protein